MTDTTPSSPSELKADGFSLQALYLEAIAHGKVLSNATGFVVNHGGFPFLLTNWHVVTGRDPVSNKPLRHDAALPDALRIFHRNTSRLVSPVVLDEPLYKAGSALWVEHPLGRDVDVIAVPLTQFPSLLYPVDLKLRDSDMMPYVGMAVSIVGYPLGFGGPATLAIWKTGHIASDPSVPYANSPLFLIDATTRGGMSGSPVVAVANTYVSRKTGMFMLTGPPETLFLGVYSGRIHKDSEIGHVWRASVIDEILSRAPQLTAPDGLEMKTVRRITLLP